nr:hypothetical protein [Coxiella burnetii]
MTRFYCHSSFPRRRESTGALSARCARSALGPRLRGDDGFLEIKTNVKAT